MSTGAPLAAARQGSRFDHAVRVISLAGQSIPVFVLGLIFLSITLRLIPPLLNRAGHFFLVTTDGFVLAAGRKLSGLPLTEISAASREPGLMGAKLVLQRRSEKALVLPIARVYGTRALREMEETLTTAIKASGQQKKKKTKR